MLTRSSNIWQHGFGKLHMTRTSFFATSAKVLVRSPNLNAASSPTAEETVTDRDGISFRRLEINRSRQRRLLRKKPAQPVEPKVLKVAIIGAPNAGKSTLANQVLGWRFSSVSSKVHTTREKILGIKSYGDTQLVLLDTPGMIPPSKIKRHNLERTLLTDPHSALFDADAIVVVVDVSKVWNRVRLDPEVLKTLHLHKNKTSVLVLNKVDEFGRKKELLHTARQLSGGVIDGSTKWAEEATIRKNKVKDLIQKVSQKQGMGNSNFSKQSDCNIKNTENFKTNSAENELQRLFNKHEKNLSSSVDATHQRNTRSDSSGEDSNCKENFNTLSPGEAVHYKDSNSSIAQLSSQKQDKELAENCSQNLESVREISSQCDEKEQHLDEVNQEVLHLDKTHLDFKDTQAWQDYYFRRLRSVSKAVRTSTFFTGFSRVFYISALNNVGTQDLETYLLSLARPGAWEFNPDVVTTQDPVEVAKQCIKEKLLDNLPNEIPYNVQVLPVLWHEDEDGMLRGIFHVVCTQNRQLFYVLGGDGSNIRRVASQAKQELMNTFRRDLSLKLIVRDRNKYDVDY